MRRIQVIDHLDLWVIVLPRQTEMVTDGRQSEQNHQPPLDKMNRLLREGRNVQHSDSKSVLLWGSGGGTHNSNKKESVKVKLVIPFFYQNLCRLTPQLPCLLHYHSDVGPELGNGVTGQWKGSTVYACVRKDNMVTQRRTHTLTPRATQVPLNVDPVVL